MDNEEGLIQPAALSPRNCKTYYNKPVDERKRKHDKLEGDEPTQWFEARILTSYDNGQSPFVSLVPISTILRAHLPLAWLSASISGDLLSANTVLQADIPCVTRWDYHVLVARHAPNGGLYAIERLEVDTFVCHRLASFVTLKCVQDAAIGATPPLRLDDVLSPACRSHSRKPSAISMSSSTPVSIKPSSPKFPKNRRGMLARQSILARDRTLEANQDESQAGDEHGSFTRPKEVEIGTLLNHTNMPRPVSAAADLSSTSTQLPMADSGSRQPEELVQINVRAHRGNSSEQVDQLSADYLHKRYFEMLYLSQTSLAFYAKGPVSRTRARARAPGASLNTQQLTVFYRESIVTAKKLDQKYKESLPAKILSLASKPQDVDIDPKALMSGSSLVDRKKPKKSKLGKDGFWPMEDEYVKRWWTGRSSAGGLHDASTATAEMRDAISQLRMREIELQIILLLEVLALEANETPKSMRQESADPVAETQDHSIEPTTNRRLAKTLKRRDLNSDLEALLDKFCILHSVSLDDEAAPEHKLASLNSAPLTGLKDRLRDFCKDVVVPFYAVKLPQQSRNICSKLGGPTLTPYQAKVGGGRAVARIVPGAAIAAQDGPSTKRTLERVLSEDSSMRNASPPVLSRSATVPAATSIKLEADERPVSRGRMQKSMSFTNREIDLVADAKLTAAKRRKLDFVASQKRDLQAAIEALKKPNREVAARGFMDDVERRNHNISGATKKIEPVQITSTPKRVRSRPMTMDDYELPLMPSVAFSPDEAFVPSSTVKARTTAKLPKLVKGSASKQAVLSAIHDTDLSLVAQTPRSERSETDCSLRSGLATTMHASSATVELTPARKQTFTGLGKVIEDTPTGPALRRHPTSFSSARHSDTITDVSAGEPFKDIAAIPEKANLIMERAMRSSGREMEVSIYDSLGWNDEYDL